MNNARNMEQALQNNPSHLLKLKYKFKITLIFSKKLQVCVTGH